MAHSPLLLIGFDNVISTPELTAPPHNKDGDNALFHVSSVTLLIFWLDSGFCYILPLAASSTSDAPPPSAHLFNFRSPRVVSFCILFRI